MRIKSSLPLVAGLVMAFGVGTAAFGESAADYVDDATITAKIKVGLVKDQALKAFDIGVTTNQGVVDLTGNVKDPVQKADAERIAKDVDGVKDIKNEITVQ
jgi:osmotically-inducible protein OsmY